MKSWYERSYAVQQHNDGSTRREYHIVFETDSVVLKEIVEKYLESIMDNYDESGTPIVPC